MRAALAAPSPLLLLAAVGLVLLNAFFVAAEFAIVKVRRSQLEIRVGRGETRARVAAHVVDHLDAYLSATQLGITLASLGLGWIGEPAVARLIEGPMHALGVSDPALVEGISFAIAFLLITMAHIVVGELAPKSLAIRRPEKVALWTALPLRLFYRVFRPFIWALNGLASVLLRLGGLGPASEKEIGHSEEELSLLLSEAGSRRQIDPQRAAIIQRTFELKDLVARDVMTPRNRLEILDARTPFDELLAKAEESGYSRFPLVEGSLDRVLGIVHYRDLARLARSPAPQRDVAAIKRPVIVAPPTRGVADLLSDMLRRGRHMAVIVDEHGSTAGLVTLEDVFEELFGEIRDEFDTEAEALYSEVGEGHYVMSAAMPLHEASRVLGRHLEAPDVATLGGFLVALEGRIPNKGERLSVGDLVFTIREADRRRVTSVDVQRA